ncbi:MAG TPA: hypothetical protein VK633_05050, partial [Verrucomicrobiae bacterium]|nr:hypothetical protein [Verrucomicrobiae bacterium]
IAAGMIGGAAYLAKSYGLPFFLVHLPGIIVLRYWSERSSTSWKAALRAWFIAMVAFCLVAGPWIGLLSAKYGRLTFSTVAQVAHSLMGPHDKPRGHPTDVLRTPGPDRLTVWETPDVLPYNHWSPFESRDYFRHQVNLVGRNVVEMVKTFGDFDLLNLYPGVLLLLPLFFLHRRDKGFQDQTGWTLWTIALYAGGFLPIYYEARYVAPFLWPLGFLYLFGALARYGGSELSPKRSLPLATSCLAAICALSFALPAVYEVQAMIRRPSTPAWRNLAHRLEQLGTRGPIAVSPGLKNEGMLVSYLSSRQFLGPASGQSVLAVEAGLEKFGAGTLLVRETKWPLANDFLTQTRWKLQETFQNHDIKIHIFTPPAENQR